MRAPERHRRLVAQPPSRPPQSSWWMGAPRETWQEQVDRESRERMRGSKEEMNAPLNGQPRA